MGRQVVRQILWSKIASSVHTSHWGPQLVGTREIPVFKLSITKCMSLSLLILLKVFLALFRESSSVLSGRSHDLAAHPQDHPMLGKTSSGPPALDMSRVGSGNLPISSSLPPSSRIDSLSSSREPPASQMELPASRIEPPSVSQVVTVLLEGSQVPAINLFIFSQLIVGVF